MKITIELETDEDKATAVRFLGSDASPITATLEGRGSGLRVLLALRQANRPNAEARDKIRAERLAKRRKA